MSEHKFTDEEIMKAIEHCVNYDTHGSCAGCPLDEISCIDKDSELLNQALALFNRQKAEIEKLQGQLILKNNALLNITYIAKRFPQTICDHCFPDFNREDLPVNVWKAREGYEAIDALVEQIMKEALV